MKIKEAIKKYSNTYSSSRFKVPLTVLFFTLFSFVFLDELLRRVLVRYAETGIIRFFRTVAFFDLGIGWVVLCVAAALLFFAYAGISISYEKYSLYSKRGKSIAFIALAMIVASAAAWIFRPVLSLNVVIIVVLANSLSYVYRRLYLLYFFLAELIVAAYLFSGRYVLSSVIISSYLSIIFIRWWKRLWLRYKYNIDITTAVEDKL